ncbi:MAG: hypothetical protein ABH851_06525 [Methanobacteriota archaeon]
MRRKSGWAKYQIKHRAKIGNDIQIRGMSWQIYAEHGNRSILEERKKKDEKWQEEKIKEGWVEKYNYTVWVYKIVKNQRQSNYRKFDWYRLVRRPIEGW